MKTTTLKDQRGFAHVVIVLIVVALVAGAGYFTYQRVQSAKDAKKANSTSNLPGAASTTKRLAIIKAAESSASIDATGKAVAPTTSFTANGGKIIVVSTLQSPKKDSKIEYVRYRDNKFVDNGSLTVPKDGAQYANFEFAPKAGKQHPIGTYKVKVYADGVYQTSVTYMVK